MNKIRIYITYFWHRLTKPKYFFKEYDMDVLGYGVGKIGKNK